VSRWTPCKRQDFIKRLRLLGFEGPYTGTKHQFMLYQRNRLTIPSNNEYSIPQLKMMIKEIEGIISRKILLDEWNEL